MIPEGLRDFEWIQGLLQGKASNGSFKGVRYSIQLQFSQTVPLNKNSIATVAPPQHDKG